MPVTLLGLMYLWLDKMSLGQLTRESRTTPVSRDTLKVEGPK